MNDNSNNNNNNNNNNNKNDKTKSNQTDTASHLNSPERQSATVGMDTYFVRATRRAHFRI